MHSTCVVKSVSSTTVTKAWNKSTVSFVLYILAHSSIVFAVPDDSTLTPSPPAFKSTFATSSIFTTLSIDPPSPTKYTVKKWF